MGVFLLACHDFPIAYTVAVMGYVSTSCGQGQGWPRQRLLQQWQGQKQEKVSAVTMAVLTTTLVVARIQLLLYCFCPGRCWGSLCLDQICEEGLNDLTALTTALLMECQGFTFAAGL